MSTLLPVPPEGIETCLHCAVGKLQHEQFKNQPIDLSISQLLDLIGDWIAGESLKNQLTLLEFTEATMMRNRREILGGVWKREGSPQ